MENKDKSTLEVGDRIYIHSYGVYSGPYIIERVTATQAFTKGHKFKRELQGQYKFIKEIGGSKWSSTSFRLETPEIMENVRARNIKSKVVNFNFASLSTEKLEQILAIISEQKPTS